MSLIQNGDELDAVWLVTLMYKSVVSKYYNNFSRCIKKACLQYYQTNQPGILGICPEVLIISPAFMFSVARMYFSWSLPATRAILAVLHPSSITWITLSSNGFPSFGPFLIHAIQWYLCLIPPPIPLAITRPLKNYIKWNRKFCCKSNVDTL